MGLLDQVLGSVLNNGGMQGQGQQQPQGGMMDGGGGGGLGGIVSMIARNPQLLQMIIGMLSNRGGGGGQARGGSMPGGGLGGLLAGLGGAGTGAAAGMGGMGGLGGLMAQFEQAGLGGAMQSWIGPGANQEVSGQQISQALGDDTIADMASQLNMPAGDVADQLSQMLPGLVDHFTPNGQVPAEGLGSSEDMLAKLGAELGPR